MSCGKHVNFSTNASFEKSSSTLSDTSEESFSTKSKKLSNKASTEKSVNPPKDLSDKIIVEKEIMAELIHEDINDIIDETNNDIMTFLSDMYIQDEYQPDIEDLLEESMAGDEDYEENARGSRDVKKCCCSCHQKMESTEHSKHKSHKNGSLTEYDGANCSVKEISAPSGTNITIPIYAAAPMTPIPNQRIVWPPGDSLFCPNRPQCPQRHMPQNHSHNRPFPCQSRQRCHQSYERPFHNCRNDLRNNFNNQNNVGYKEQNNKSRNYSDTMNFETEFDHDDNNGPKERNKDFTEKTFNNNRLNRIGSPMNWDEIFKYLD